MKHKCFIGFMFSLITTFALNAHAQIITTYAGNGVQGYGGDGGQATGAAFNWAQSIAIDSAGNIYLGDLNNARVRKITPAGIVSTFAGNGAIGFSGDDSAATTAKLFDPTGVACDRYGNVYIADKGNARVRKVNPAGIITTVAGNGTVGFSGDGGPATAAKLAAPTGVAADTLGNIYITNGTASNRLRKVNAGGIISTIAGNGVAAFGGDWGPATAASFNSIADVAVDKTGIIYIADVGNNRIRKIDLAGIITTFAGTGAIGSTGDGGPATAAQLTTTGVTLDDAGNVYIPDQQYGRVRKVDHITGIIATIAGDGTPCGFGGDGGPATAAQLCAPYRMAVDKNGTIYFCDLGNSRIRRIKYTVGIEEINSVASNITITPNPASAGLFTIKVSCDITEAVNIVVTNIAGQKIKEITTTTNKPTDIQLNAPSGVYFAVVCTAHGVWSEKVVVEN